MKHGLVLALFLGMAELTAHGQNRNLQQGTIVRMRMGECMAAQHGWMTAMSGASQKQSDELCPEYVLVTEKVVYLVVGKNSEQLIPLAEYTKFHLRNNELLIRVDDAPKESHFRIKEMILRSDWDRVHHNTTDEESKTGQENPDRAMLAMPR